MDKAASMARETLEYTLHNFLLLTFMSEVGYLDFHELLAFGLHLMACRVGHRLIIMFLGFLFGGHDTPEPQMIGSGADFTFAACADHVAGAVLIRAEKRPATVHALFFIGFAGIE